MGFMWKRKERGWLDRSCCATWCLDYFVQTGYSVGQGAHFGVGLWIGLDWKTCEIHVSQVRNNE